MAWTEAARKKSAEARRRRSQLNPKPSKDDIYARVKAMKRSSTAAALKWGRNSVRKKYEGPGRNASREFLNAFYEGQQQANRYK